MTGSDVAVAAGGVTASLEVCNTRATVATHRILCVIALTGTLLDGKVASSGWVILVWRARCDGANLWFDRCRGSLHTASKIGELVSVRLGPEAVGVLGTRTGYINALQSIHNTTLIRARVVFVSSIAAAVITWVITLSLTIGVC